MNLTLELSLPRDARCVRLLRRVAACVFDDIGAPAAAVEDIQLALTEACANAVRHAVGSQEYSVAFTVDGQGCTVEVLDLGPGFPFPVSGEHEAAELDEETGRGLLLMDELVDDLHFSRRTDGTQVTLRKYWPDVGLELAQAPSTARDG